MGFADAGWAEQQDVLLAFEDGEPSQLAQLAFVYRRLEVEVELVQSLVVGEVRPLGLQAHVAAMLGLALGFERLFEEVQIRQVLGGGFFGDGLEAVGQMRQAQPQHVVQQAFRLRTSLFRQAPTKYAGPVLWNTLKCRLGRHLSSH